MTRDYVLHSVSMDDPQLIAYIRQVQLVPTTHQDPPNATQSSEENYVASLFQGKRDGVYLEYISRVCFVGLNRFDVPNKFHSSPGLVDARVRHFARSETRFLHLL